MPQRGCAERGCGARCGARAFGGSVRGGLRRHPRAAAPTLAAAAVPSAAPSAPAAAAAARDGDRIRSTPVARKLAAERGIDLGGITGTGPGGRVQLEDVERAAAAPRPNKPAAQSLTPMRRALARAMSLSKRHHSAVHRLALRRLDRAADAARRVLREIAGCSPKLSLTDFLLQAVARALIEFPALNATFSGDPDSPDARIVAAAGAHIGLVVAVDNGLLVPVIHDVERLGLAEIMRRREDCVERGHQGPAEARRSRGPPRSAFSNLGAEGPDRFTAIINPPQSAILAVGRRRDCVGGDERGPWSVRPQSDLTLTVDHRVADGRLAAQFLARLVAILEGRDWRVDNLAVRPN